MRRTLSDKGVAALKARPQRYAFPDPELTGHYIRVQPSGTKSFAAVARTPDGRQVWHTVGPADAMHIAEARDKARDALNRLRIGLPPIEAKAETFGDVAANWVKRHVVPNGLRSRKNIELLLASHVSPTWQNREFISIRRSDVAALLDEVEDGHSSRQADAVLTIVRSICNWYAARHDDYTPPIVRGMRRQNAKAQARARILDDHEIRSIWSVAESGGRFGGIVRLALLTAQRRAKVAAMRWQDISIDGEWTIPKEAREKDSGGTLVLPDAAIAIVRAQPRMGDNPYVFAGRSDRPFNGYSKAKRAFDAKLPADMPGWVLHDLRRTARSLMSRSGIRPDIAERVMGHAIAGVEGVYDRHSYRDEKAEALRRLAALIATILDPPKGNVRPIRERMR